MLALLGILILALGLRLVSLNQSLWLDEAINVVAARDRGVIDLLTNYSIGDFHPPLYHFILHYWINIFGASEASVRLPSIIFGLVTIYFTYKTSSLLINKKNFSLFTFHFSLDLIPPLLLATSGLHIYYSQEARMYSLAAMFATMAIYYSLVIVNSSPQPLLHRLTHLFHRSIDPISPAQVMLIFSLVGMLYTDYVPWLLLPLFFFIIPVPALISFALTLPWWPYFYRQLATGLSVATNFPGWGRVVGGISLKNIALIPVKFLIGRVTLDNKILYALLLVTPLLIILTLLTYMIKISVKQRKRSQLILLAWLFVPLTLGILLSFKVSLLSYFRFLFVLPAFYLVLGLAISHLKPKLAILALSVLLIVNITTSLAYLFMPKFHREDWHGFSVWLDQQPVLDSATIIPSLAQAAPYQYYQHTIPVTDQIDPQTLPSTIYLIRYVQEIFDPADSLRLSLEKLGYTRTSIHNFNSVVVWVYHNSNRVFAQIQEK